MQWKIQFPDNSVGKESACNAGDPGLIPGLGRSAGEGISYPPQYSWVSLVAQLVKNLPAVWETWVRSLGWEDPLKKGKATQSSILAWRIPWTAAHQVSLSITNSHSLLKLISIKVVMPSNHLILCLPFLLLPSMFPSIRVFSSESVLCIRWPQYWSFSICPLNIHN